MGIKKYIIASLLLIIGIAGYVFSIASGDFRIEILDKAFILPIAVWVIVPVVVLFIASLLHMSFYGLKNYFASKGMEKDISELASFIELRLINKPSTSSFKNKKMQEVAQILEQIDFNITNKNFTTPNEQIQELAEQIIKINEGEYISNKKLQLASKTNLMEKNILNRIQEEDNFALEIIKQPSSYKDSIVREAFIKAVDIKSMTTIKKLLPSITLDTVMFKALIAKDSQEDAQFALDNESLFKMITKLNLSTEDLIAFAKEYKETIAPERLIKLFEDLITNDEKYTESYLYVLSEYEMMDDMREVLVNSQKDEYIIYKAYLDLRDASKHYSLNSFL